METVRSLKNLVYDLLETSLFSSSSSSSSSLAVLSEMIDATLPRKRGVGTRSVSIDHGHFKPPPSPLSEPPKMPPLKNVGEMLEVAQEVCLSDADVTVMPSVFPHTNCCC